MKRNQEVTKAYLEKNKEKIKEQKKEYYLKNKDKFINYGKEYRTINRVNLNKKRMDKKKNNNIFRLSCNSRTLINSAFKQKGFKKLTKTEILIGCSFELFKQYLESKFEAWMNWDNYGKYNGELNYGWDVDHMIPLSSAKSEEELLKLLHYDNCQPLCSYTNRHVKRNQINVK